MTNTGCLCSTISNYLAALHKVTRASFRFWQVEKRLGNARWTTGRLNKLSVTLPLARSLYL